MSRRHDLQCRNQRRHRAQTAEGSEGEGKQSGGGGTGSDNRFQVGKILDSFSSAANESLIESFIVLPGPSGALFLVLQQHDEAAQTLLGQHGLFEQRLADVHGEGVDQTRLHHHLHRQLAHDHVGGCFVVRQGRLQTLQGRQETASFEMFGHSIRHPSFCTGALNFKCLLTKSFLH